jgi:Cof subfamily protein (haloacid dehalogenase superfamily)
MMAFKMLVLDIDGTLLDPTSTLTKRTKRAVREALASGCIVTLATGRHYASAKPFADELELQLPIILHNGALIKNSQTGEVLYHDHLPSGAAAAAVAACVERHVQPILYENAFSGDGVMTGPDEHDGPFARPYLQRKGALVRRLPYASLLPINPPLQLAVFDREQLVRAIESALSYEGCRSTVSLTSSGGYFLEFLSARSSKATGIRHLTEKYGLDMADVIAVGDNFNDLEMLQESGFGVAMGNAPQPVRDQAHATTGSNAEDGVAQAIERYVLGKG